MIRAKIVRGFGAVAGACVLGWSLSSASCAPKTEAITDYAGADAAAEDAPPAPILFDSRAMLAAADPGVFAQAVQASGRRRRLHGGEHRGVRKMHDRSPAGRVRSVFDAQGDFVPSFRACGPCVETRESADRWGGIVITEEQTGEGFNNVAGCLGKIAGDGDSTSGCGRAAFELQQCWAAACPQSVCPLGNPAKGGPQTKAQLAAYDACVRDASKESCAAYDEAFAVKCAAVLGDAATSQCGGGEGASAADHVAAVLTVICGGAPDGDAGGP